MCTYMRASLRVWVGLHTHTCSVHVQLTVVLDGKITFVGKTKQTSRRLNVYIYIYKHCTTQGTGSIRGPKVHGATPN